MVKVELEISDKDLIAILSKAIENGGRTSCFFPCKGASNDIDDPVSAVLIESDKGSYVRCPRLIEIVRELREGKKNQYQQVRNYCWMGDLDKSPPEYDASISDGDLAEPCGYCTE